jgi:hypothetical protein
MVETRNNQPAIANKRFKSSSLGRLLRAAAICSALLLSSAAAFAQSRNPMPQPTPEEKLGPGQIDFSSRVDEMRRILLLKAEKKAYHENLARAKEAEQLATDLKDSYEAKDAFTPEDQKKLERLEKLTKRIRNEAGGSDSENEQKELPSTLKSAVSSLADMAEGLCKEVRKTPRRVLSVNIIGRANKLIGVIQFVREKVR